MCSGPLSSVKVVELLVGWRLSWTLSFTFLLQILGGSGADRQDREGGITALHMCPWRETGSKHMDGWALGAGNLAHSRPRHGDPGPGVGEEPCSSSNSLCKGPRPARRHHESEGARSEDASKTRHHGLTSHIKGFSVYAMGRGLLWGQAEVGMARNTPRVSPGRALSVLGTLGFDR